MKMTLAAKRRCLCAAKKYLRHTFNKGGDSLYHHIYLDEDKEFLYFGNGHIFFQVEADSWCAKGLVCNPPAHFDVLEEGDMYSDYAAFFHSADRLFDGRNEPCNKSVTMYAIREKVENTINSQMYVVENPKEINVLCKFAGKICKGTYDMAFDARMILAICETLGLNYIQFYADEMLYRPVVCQYQTEGWGLATVLFQNLLRPEDKERMAICEEITSKNPSAALWRLKGKKKLGLVKRKPKEEEEIPF